MTQRSLVKQSVKDLTAYSIEVTDVPVKLDAMENPYPLPQEVAVKVSKELQKVLINRYPDPGQINLRKKFGTLSGTPPENILVGNGSDELIQIILTACASSGENILYPTPTFSMYGLIASTLDLPCIEVSLNLDNWEIDTDSFLDAMHKEKPAVIFISNPNNPTGNNFDKNFIREVIETAPGVVVLDEAYYDFSKTTFLPAIKKHKNLIVLRTLSKIGMAGLRVGFLMANEELCTEINKVRLPYNSNSLSQAVGNVLLDEMDSIQKQIDMLIRDRETLFQDLKQLEGVAPYTSETNFILFKTEKNSVMLYRELLKSGVLVRSFSQSSVLKEHLRVSVGTHDENKKFMQTLSKLV